MQALTKELHTKSSSVFEDDNDDALITLDEYFASVDNIVGRLVAGHRYKNNITQKQLAEKLGVSVRRISEWENGRREISEEDADRISVAVGMSRELFRRWKKKK